MIVSGTLSSCTTCPTTAGSVMVRPEHPTEHRWHPKHGEIVSGRSLRGHRICLSGSGRNQFTPIGAELDRRKTGERFRLIAQPLIKYKGEAFVAATGNVS